jgi:patatin-like phospholipase/acyl hydrolase
MFPILSIDGGGIRGIIPALILAELEKRTGRQVHELFQLVAGTSTGGLLALGLAVPGRSKKKARYSAGAMVDLYQNDGSRIFARSVWHRARAMGSLAEEKYPSDGIEEVLREKFGETRLTDALVPVLVTSYDIELRRPHFFKSHKAKADASRDYLMRDAGRATSAAPTYFEPAYVRVDDDSDAVALVDGGVFANNPSACALVEAICEFGVRPEEIALLSLGTGELTRPLLYEDARGWGLARWAQPVLNVVFDGVSDTVSYQVESILGSTAGDDRYLRIQIALDEGNDDMDDAGSTNLRVLKLLARNLIHRYDRELDAWAELLTGSSKAPE